MHAYSRHTSSRLQSPVALRLVTRATFVRPTYRIQVRLKTNHTRVYPLLIFLANLNADSKVIGPIRGSPGLARRGHTFPTPGSGMSSQYARNSERDFDSSYAVLWSKMRVLLRILRSCILLPIILRQTGTTFAMATLRCCSVSRQTYRRVSDRSVQTLVLPRLQRRFFRELAISGNSNSTVAE